MFQTWLIGFSWVWVTHPQSGHYPHGKSFVSSSYLASQFQPLGTPSWVILLSSSCSALWVLTHSIVMKHDLPPLWPALCQVRGVHVEPMKPMRTFFLNPDIHKMYKHHHECLATYEMFHFANKEKVKDQQIEHTRNTVTQAHGHRGTQRLEQSSIIISAYIFWLFPKFPSQKGHIFLADR